MIDFKELETIANLHNCLIADLKKTKYIRDMTMFRAYKEGARMIDIAEVVGLNEHRVKHIIADIRKELS